MKRDLPHETATGILPWYVNGTISDEEREAIDGHLTRCAECRDELALLTAVSESAAAIAAETPPVADGWRTTLAAIDEWEAAQPPRGWRRVAAALAPLWSPPPAFARAALAAQLAVIVVLAALLLARPADTPLATLSGGDGARAGVRLTLAFNPDATEGDIRRLLLDLDAVVVDGPSALGVYVVELPDGDRETAAVDAAIDRLRGERPLIRFVERQP